MGNFRHNSFYKLNVFNLTLFVSHTQIYCEWLILISLWTLSPMKIVQLIRLQRCKKCLKWTKSIAYWIVFNSRLNNNNVNISVAPYTILCFFHSHYASKSILYTKWHIEANAIWCRFEWTTILWLPRAIYYPVNVFSVEKKKKFSNRYDNLLTHARTQFY